MGTGCHNTQPYSGKQSGKTKRLPEIDDFCRTLSTLAIALSPICAGTSNQSAHASAMRLSALGVGEFFSGQSPTRQRTRSLSPGDIPLTPLSVTARCVMDDLCTFVVLKRQFIILQDLSTYPFSAYRPSMIKIPVAIARMDMAYRVRFPQNRNSAAVSAPLR